MDEVALYSISGMSSSSPAMFARRRRILSEARRLIARGQSDGFSVRELSVKAGVAPNTLYNAFGSKDNIIALAISQYFEDFYATLEFPRPADSIAGVMERDMTTTIRNLSIPHYVRAVASLYFSNSANVPLRDVLIRIGGYPYLPWLQKLMVRRQLERGVDIDRVVVTLSSIAWSQVHEWRLGALTDESFVVAHFDAVLSYLGGVTKGEARKEVRALFSDLHGCGDLFAEYRRQAEGLLEQIHSAKK